MSDTKQHFRGRGTQPGGTPQIRREGDDQGEGEGEVDGVPVRAGRAGLGLVGLVRASSGQRTTLLWQLACCVPSKHTTTGP